MSASFTSCIVCDDVRREISGKDILIGVYTADIVLSSYPATIPLSFWIEFEPVEEGELNVEFKVDSPSENPPVEGLISITVKVVRTTGITVSHIPVSVEEDGHLIFSVRTKGGEWKELRRKNIRRRKSA